jgi:hypothetical protein
LGGVLCPAGKQKGEKEGMNPFFSPFFEPNPTDRRHNASQPEKTKNNIEGGGRKLRNRKSTGSWTFYTTPVFSSQPAGLKPMSGCATTFGIIRFSSQLAGSKPARPKKKLSFHFKAT